MKWLALLMVFLCPACRAQSANSDKPQTVAPGVQLLAQITDSRITESSGIAASRTHTNVFWTHNDGGRRRQVLYAINRRGETLADWRVVGATLEDWEDIAIADGRLFIGDIGNNDAKRSDLAVHEVEEPDPANVKTGLVLVKRSWTLKFPKEPFDCEALWVWRDYGYVVSKVFKNARASVYRFSLTNPVSPQTLEFVAQLRIDSPVTAGDISPDGKVVAIVAKNGVYAYRIDGDPLQLTRVRPQRTRFRHDHIEAATFVPDGLLATAESREIFLFTDPMFIPMSK